MPVVMAQLASGLAAVFKSRPATGVLAASKIAAEYDKYCKGAMAPPGLPVFTGSEKPALEVILAGALASPGGSAASVAAAFAAGIQAYWLTPPVPFVGGPAAGVVTGMPGAAAVVAPITAALLSVKNTEDTCAQAIATALDTATKTVLVTYATPPPPTGPPPPSTVI